jgi:type II secretory ATPase GspE/PulE/Tfp pilus assembly ATPase PilB-like protein
VAQNHAHPRILSEATPAEESAPEALEQLIQRAEKANASDVHLQMTPRGAEILFRLDGVMSPAGDLAGDIAERVFGRIKFLAKLKTYQESLPQDGRIEKADLNAHADIRVATYPTVTGEKIVLRLFNETQARALAELGFPLDALEQLQWFLRQTSGLLLLTGPAGSGKTATIYGCLRELAKGGGRHIITVEDPAEQIIPGIMQTEVNEARGLDYARAARHLLRQDPQVLVIGEIRDDETAVIAVRAALTGHLVISTLHAGSCSGVFERLAAFCPDASAIAGSAQLILNQRLVRKLCVQCRGAGCGTCLQTGYHGRVPLAESLRVTPELRRCVTNRDWEQLEAKPTLLDAAAKLIAEGITDRREIERVLGRTL